MVFLHIVPPSTRMMNTFMSEIRKRFNKDEHIFYFINSCPLSERKLFEYENVFEMTGNTRFQKILHFEKFINKSDYIIWHGMTYQTRHILFASRPKVLKKSIWLMWGIDLYNWKVPSIGIKNLIKNKLNHYWRNHVKNIISLLPFDEEFFHKEFPKSKAKFYNIPYPIGMESFHIMNSLSNWQNRENGKICVQVAHNAHVFNNHKEILNKLAKFQDENISLYLPLSYGPEPPAGEKYINGVIHEAITLFPNKTFCLRKLIPLNKYMRFLWNMDIVVLYAHRQNALGNICRQLYMGNKIFLSPKSPTYKFLKDKNIEIFSTDDIPNMTYEEFIKRPSNENAKKWIIDTYLPDNIFALWSKMIVELGGNGENPREYSQYEELASQELPCIYKDNIPNIYKYLKWKIDISKSLPTVIIGTGMNAQYLAMDLSKYNKAHKRHRYHMLGFIKTAGENDVLPDTDFGDLSKLSLDNEYNLFCAVHNGTERATIIGNLESNDFFINQWIPEHIQNVVSDNGCVVTRNSTILRQTVLKKGVLIDNGYVGSFCLIDDYATLEDSCFIGNYCKIGKYTTIYKNSYVYQASIGNYNHIGPFTKIGNNSIIGDNTKFIYNCTVGDILYDAQNNEDIAKADVCIGNNVCCDSNIIIHSQCFIGDNTNIASNCEIGFNTKIGTNCTIGKNVKIGNNCILGNNIKIEDYSVIEDNTVI